MVTTGTVAVLPSLRVYVTLDSAIVAEPDSHCSTISWLTPSTVSQKPAHTSRTASRPMHRVGVAEAERHVVGEMRGEAIRLHRIDVCEEGLPGGHCRIIRFDGQRIS